MKGANLLKYYGMNIVPWGILHEDILTPFVSQPGLEWQYYSKPMPDSKKDGKCCINYQDRLTLYNSSVTMSLAYYPEDKSQNTSSFSWDMHPQTILQNRPIADSVKGKDLLSQFANDPSKAKILCSESDLFTSLYNVTGNHYYRASDVDHPSRGVKTVILVNVFPGGFDPDRSRIFQGNPTDIHKPNYIEVRVVDTVNKKPFTVYSFRFNDNKIVEVVEKLLKPHSFIKSDKELTGDKYKPLNDSNVDGKEIGNVADYLLKISRIVMDNLNEAMVAKTIVHEGGAAMRNFLSMVSFNLFLATAPLNDNKPAPEFKRVSKAYELPEILSTDNQDPAKIKVAHAMKHIFSLESSEIHPNGKSGLFYYNMILFAQEEIELKRSQDPSSIPNKMKIFRNKTINNMLPNNDEIVKLPITSSPSFQAAVGRTQFATETNNDNSKKSGSIPSREDNDNNTSEKKTTNDVPKEETTVKDPAKNKAADDPAKDKAAKDSAKEKTTDTTSKKNKTTESTPGKNNKTGIHKFITSPLVLTITVIIALVLLGSGIFFFVNKGRS